MKRSRFLKYLFGGISSLGLLLESIRSERSGATSGTAEPLRKIALYDGYVAGYAYSNAHKVASYLRKGTPLELRTEANNPYDTSAVRVLVHGWRVGYLPRGENKTIAKMMEQGIRPQGEISSYKHSNPKSQRLEIRVWIE